MWVMIPSLQGCVDCLAGTFTQPSFATHCQLLLAWLMCLGQHTLFRVAENTQPQQIPDHSRRHRFDAYYNFFERSAWTAQGLAHRVGILILTRLKFFGPITLLVDDTLAHKRGKCVWGLGWFRDARCVPPDWPTKPLAGREVTVSVEGRFWQAESFDPATGKSTGKRKLEAKQKRLKISLPEFRGSVAVKLERLDS